MIDLITFGISGILTVVASLISIILLILTIVFGIIRAIKKKFKKTFIILLIISILFGIMDFFVINNLIKNFNEIDINNDKSINIRQEDGKMILSDNPIEQLLMSDDKKTEIICQYIMNKIETKDYETIKHIFSKDAINNIENLDDGINELINISNEGITNVESQMNGSETHWDSGQHRKTYRFSCDITTNSTKYIIGFEYDYENPFNSETLGGNRMAILDKDRNVLVLVDNETTNKGY